MVCIYVKKIETMETQTPHQNKRALSLSNQAVQTITDKILCYIALPGLSR